MSRVLRLSCAVLCVLTGSAAAAPIADDTHNTPRWLVPSLHGGAVLLGTRLSCSLIWPEAYDVTRTQKNWSNFKRAWSSAPEFDTSRPPFEWDGDPWTLNVIGHGLLGSEIYLRHRQGYHLWWSALAMTAAWTVVWEHGIESWHKQPSGIDLIWSPLGGALIGEGRYRLVLIVRGMQDGWGRHLLLYLVDPLGQLERDLLDLEY